MKLGRQHVSGQSRTIPHKLRVPDWSQAPEHNCRYADQEDVWRLIGIYLDEGMHHLQEALNLMEALQEEAPPVTHTHAEETPQQPEEDKSG